MNEFEIAALNPVPAFDSRGTPTVSCEVVLRGGARATIVVPSGASTGAHEAVELRDGGTAFGGRGVTRAVAGIREHIAPALTGIDARDQQAVDGAMLRLDRSLTTPEGRPERLGGLGANAVLSVSVATALAAGAQSALPPYRYFGDAGRPLLPLPMVNIFSGGAHAAAALDVQDLLAVPVGARSLPEALSWVWEVRHAIGARLRERGLNAQLVADEGGFGVALDGTRDALRLITEGIRAAGLRPGDDVAIAIDVAASQLLHDGHYVLSEEGRTLTADELVAEIAGWCRDFPIVSVEDALAEDDWAGFATATSTLDSQQVLGDDLFVTDVDRLRRGVANGIASAVLVKPNQCGSLSATRDVVTAAHAAGYATVLSARSGETEDCWLADLSVGWRTGQIKVGSLTRSERTAKWNRLLRIAHELGDAEYAGAAALVAPRDLIGRED
ncbi:phosphopyruvate hydratase [Pseudonocardia nigra]|uniref:phosphopyruvate hydratase n=1 Tax=Pseudonocardia nigra TaxID=1921578 RepID=UPI001C5F29E8|nr:phosphopyruvate hydratase [Pseudonocardia nigra]